MRMIIIIISRRIRGVQSCNMATLSFWKKKKCRQWRLLKRGACGWLIIKHDRNNIGLIPSFSGLSLTRTKGRQRKGRRQREEERKERGGVIADPVATLAKTPTCRSRTQPGVEEGWETGCYVAAGHENLQSVTLGI